MIAKPILRQAFQDSTSFQDSSLLSKITSEYSSMSGVSRHYGGANLDWYDRLYTSSGVIHNIVTTLPRDATRHDINILIDGTEDKNVLDYLNDLQVVSRGIDEQSFKDVLYQALVFSRLYGDGFVICGYSDTKDLGKPLSKKGNLRLDWITVRSRNEISIDMNKRAYQLHIDNTSFKANVKNLKDRVEVHPSRVVRFQGVELFERALQTNQYFNRSIIDLIYSEYCRFDSTLESVSKMLKSHSAFSYAIKDLSGIVKQGKEELIRNRFKLILESIEGIGGIAHDKENESVSYLNRSYSGLNDLIDQLKASLLSVSGLPAYKLFNVASSNAMSTSADAERIDWSDRVATYQHLSIDEQICRLIKPLFPAGTKVNASFQPYYQTNESGEGNKQEKTSENTEGKPKEEEL